MDFRRTPFMCLTKTGEFKDRGFNAMCALHCASPLLSDRSLTMIRPTRLTCQTASECRITCLRNAGGDYGSLSQHQSVAPSECCCQGVLCGSAYEPLRLASESIDRTANPRRSTVEDMGVDHRRLHGQRQGGSKEKGSNKEMGSPLGSSLNSTRQPRGDRMKSAVSSGGEACFREVIPSRLREICQREGGPQSFRGGKSSAAGKEMVFSLERKNRLRQHDRFDHGRCQSRHDWQIGRLYRPPACSLRSDVNPFRQISETVSTPICPSAYRP